MQASAPLEMLLAFYISDVTKFFPEDWELSPALRVFVLTEVA